MIVLAMMLAGCGSQSTSTQNKETEKSGNSIVVYFAWPENGEDTSSSASIVMEGNEKLGSTQIVAAIIAIRIQSEMVRIVPNEDYPFEHEALVDQASEERANKTRPESRSKHWNRMPM